MRLLILSLRIGPGIAVITPTAVGTLPTIGSLPTAVATPAAIRTCLPAVSASPASAILVRRAMWRNPASPLAPVTRDGVPAAAAAAPYLDNRRRRARLGWSHTRSRSYSMGCYWHRQCEKPSQRQCENAHLNALPTHQRWACQLTAQGRPFVLRPRSFFSLVPAIARSRHLACHHGIR
jgi:hypothetical protein